jgi:pimeloyl-ACP methyl ester carboxylesterase
MPQAEINGASIHYEIVGEGYPLILIHAGIADSRLWQHQVSEFAQHYKVVRYDLRGFGLSTIPDGESSHYRDLHALLQYLHIDKAHLCGVSVGGSTAIDFTLSYPHMVSALITVGSSASGWQREMSAEEQNYWDDFGAKWDELYAAGKLDEANEMEVQLWVDGPRGPTEVDPQVRALVSEMNLTAIRQTNNNAKFVRMEPPAVNRLAEITIPTLIIVGELDTASAVQAADHLASGISGARKVVMHGLTHVPNLERPAEFNRLVLGFLENVVTHEVG